jgi:hypothetical protein
MSAELHIAPPAPQQLDALTTSQWARLLSAAGVHKNERVAASKLREVGSPTGQALSNGGITNTYALSGLPPRWQSALEALREERRSLTYAALLTSLDRAAETYEPRVKFHQLSAFARAKADCVKKAMEVFFGLQAQGRSAADVVFKTQMTFEEAAWQRRAELPQLLVDGMIKRPSRATVYLWAKRVTEAGGIESAPIEAYAEERKGRDMTRLKKEVPPEFLIAMKSEAGTSGSNSAALRKFQLDWFAGREVPGFGKPDALQTQLPLPVSERWLFERMPGKAAKVQASRGVFAAKTAGLLAAPALNTDALRLREIILFDDKRLDIKALDDDTGEQVDVTLYIAMDASTREILGYLMRGGHVRETDVDGLVAFTLSRAGFALPQSAGYATTLKFERGTVACSETRERMIKNLCPGINISRTTMIGGANGGGQWSQVATGNFFGKAKLESFMAVLDRYTRHLAGQRGNNYANQPAMLGDTVLTAKMLRAPGYQRKHTMLEEAVLNAQLGRALDWAKTGETLPAAQACERQGVKPNTLWMWQLHQAVQELIVWHNAERGTRKEGRASVWVTAADGHGTWLAESGTDKAARLEMEMQHSGHTLSRLSDGDTMLLLHKVKHVTVRARDGVSIQFASAKRRYWHPDSLACHQAARHEQGEKTFLALYNPENPDALYILDNPPSHVARGVTELPAGFSPVFLEALPLYAAPMENDAAAMQQRAREVHQANIRIAQEVNQVLVPFVNDATERRQANNDLAEPLRAAVAVVRDAATKRELPQSEMAASLRQIIAESRAVQAGEMPPPESPSRAEERAAAQALKASQPATGCEDLVL